MILRTVREEVASSGFQPLRVREITAAAGISHQAFYGHFANKRHAVAFATSDELGAIVDLAMRAAKEDQGWAKRLLKDVDAALIEAYPSADGPEIWLGELLTEAICSEGGYESLRIVEMIRVSRLGHGEFYRRYGGKRGCLRRIYSEALSELGEEISADQGVAPLERIADAFASDPPRARLLIVGAAQLSEQEKNSSLPRLLEEAISTSLPAPADPDISTAIAAGVHEVVRSAVLGGRLDRLGDDLRMLGRGWGGGERSGLGLAA